MIIGAAITVLTSLIIALTGWIYSAVASMPKEYVAKEDYVRGLTSNEKDHERILQKMDKIYELLLRKERTK
jgi:hypothetical protein